MNVYVCTDHDGHYPVGVVSVVAAETEQQARELLDAQLREHGLKPHSAEPYSLRRLNIEIPKAFVLLDGDY